MTQIATIFIQASVTNLREENVIFVTNVAIGMNRGHDDHSVLAHHEVIEVAT